MNWLGLIAGTGAGKWLALALAVGSGVGGYWIGHRVQRASTEHVMRLWAEDRRQRAEASLKEYETRAALEARVREAVLAEQEEENAKIDALAGDVRRLSAGVRLCSMVHQATTSAVPPTGGTDAPLADGQLASAVGVLQTLATNLAERCDREAVRANALRDWVDGVARP